MAVFKKLTLDGILATFNKTLVNLETLVNDHEAQVKENTDRIEAITAENAKLAGEITRARTAAAKIRQLIGG